MKNVKKKTHNFADVVKQMDQLHRLMLDIIKDEFARLSITDVTAVQALILYHIGDNEITANEVKTVGNYQGANPQYNLKKLVENGYLHHARCELNRRSVRIRLTAHGQEIRKVIANLFEHHEQKVMERDIGLAEIIPNMIQLQDYLRGCIRHIY